MEVIKEFFMRDGQKSHTKLLTILSFPPATGIICLYAWRGTLDAEMLGVYLGAYVLGAIGSSATSAYYKRNSNTQQSSEKENY